MKRDAFSQYHPAVNFLFFLGAIGFGVVFQHPAYLLAGFVSGAIYYFLLAGRKGMGFFFALLPVFLLVTLINPLLNTYGKTPLFFLFGKPYTYEALLHGAAVAAVFLVMMLWFSCYSKVLTSDKFMGLFGGLIPSLSLLLVMVLRMIPGLTRKAAQLTTARQCIGKAGAQTSFRGKLAEGAAILSSLTDHALEGSIVTADSMRARGYGCAKRTSFQMYRMTSRDWVALVFLVLLAAAVVLAGGYDAAYTPTLQLQRPTLGLAAYWAFLLIPTTLHITEAFKWRILISRI